MPVIEVTFYRVACDHPGCQACDITDDYSAWEDADQADEVAMLSGAWLKIGHGPEARYYRERHTIWCDPCDRAEPVSHPASIGDRAWSCSHLGDQPAGVGVRWSGCSRVDAAGPPATQATT